MLPGPAESHETTAYLIHDESGPVPADTGAASDAPRVKQAVRELCGSVAPSAILLTHAHPDHSGAARAMTREWRCDVDLHPAELPIAVGNLATMASTPVRWTGGSSRRLSA